MSVFIDERTSSAETSRHVRETLPQEVRSAAREENGHRCCSAVAALPPAHAKNPQKGCGRFLFLFLLFFFLLSPLLLTASSHVNIRIFLQITAYPPHHHHTCVCGHTLIVTRGISTGSSATQINRAFNVCYIGGYEDT